MNMNNGKKSFAKFVMKLPKTEKWFKAGHDQGKAFGGKKTKDLV